MPIQGLRPSCLKLAGGELPIGQKLVEHSSSILDARHLRKVEVLADLADGLGNAVAVLDELVELGDQPLGFVGQLEGLDARFFVQRVLPRQCSLALFHRLVLRTQLALVLLQHLAPSSCLGNALAQASREAKDLGCERCQGNAPWAYQRGGPAPHQASVGGGSGIGRQGCGAACRCSGGRVLSGARSARECTHSCPRRGVCRAGRCVGRGGGSVGRLGCGALQLGGAVGLLRGSVAHSGGGVGLQRGGGREHLRGPAGKVCHQPGDLDGGPGLASSGESADNGVQVLRQRIDDLGSVGAGDQALVGFTHIKGPLGAEVLQCAAHGGGQLAELASDHIGLALQGLHDHIGCECALLCHLAQLARSNAQAVGKCLSQAGRLLHHRVELFPAQHARLQALDELGDGGPGGVSRATR